MATTITVCNPDIPASQFLEVELDDGQSRRQYTPSLWGEFFLTHEPCTPSELLSMKEKAEAKKEEVRRIVLDAAASDDLTQKLDLVDVLQRLGVAYHYKKEIDDVLCAVYDDKLGGSDDLYVTSLRFYLLRKHGYSVSSDVFVKFRDEEGNISRIETTYNMVEGFQVTDRYEVVLFYALLDDVYDNYATTEESKIFTTALERWDEKAAEQLPKSLRSFYCNVISNTNEIIEHLKIQKNMNAEAVRKLVTHVAKSYHAEVKWRDDQYIPTNVEEHLQISMPSIVAMQTANCALVSLGDVTSREAVEWAFNFPKIVRGVAIVARISNDIVSHEREQASDHMASTVQTCMKQYGVTAEEATEKLRVHVEKAWMEIVQGCLDQEYSIVLLEKVVNCARTIDFIYKREDAYTSSSKLKDTITSLYVKLV
ncbi:hypothetical protein QOZ80_8BG0648660 [Eleusine coracana subsp. coracana]|nr:hypothetical protein QOZ80_8BG0648660 [Eleusine coracana subsp. coracana]